MSEEKPNRPNHNGQEEMEKLIKAANVKRMRVGALIKPKRKPDELKNDSEVANLVIVIASSRPVEDNVVMSDEVTESLATTAKFLLEELRHG